MRFELDNKRSKRQIDMTPMLDVVFIMLIFFIVTATFVKESGIEIERPQADTGAEQQRVSILVAVSGDDDVWIEKIKLETQTPIDIDQLRAGYDLVAELLRAIEELRDDDTKLIALAEELAPLATKAAVELGECQIDLQDPKQLRNWLQQAEGLLVSQLLEADV